MKIQGAWASSHDRAAFLTGTLLLYDGQFDKARPLIERCANSNSHNATVCFREFLRVKLIWISQVCTLFSFKLNFCTKLTNFSALHNAAGLTFFPDVT
jgi:hypothetical protein